MEKLLTSHQVAKLLNVLPETLRRWEKEGKLKPLRKLGGHRRYKESQIKKLLGENQDITSTSKKSIIYARVSPAKQADAGNLQRQKERLTTYAIENHSLKTKSNKLRVIKVIKSKVTVALIIVFLFVTSVTIWLAYPQDVWAAGPSRLAGEAEAAAGESLDELKVKLGKTTDVHERRNTVDVFNAMPGPDAAAAQVLLDYLKDNPGIDIDPGNVIDALVKLMTDEQVAQLAKEIGAYINTTYNGANSYPFLVRVLSARINNPNDLTSALLSLQKGYSSERYLYLQFMQQAWPRIFSDPDEAVQWLDRIHTELSNPKARRNIVYAVGVVARQLSGADRAAVIGWLWRAQEKEPDAAYRCNQLFTLYQLGEAKALKTLDGLYAGLASAKERADLIRIIAGSNLSQQKEAGINDLIEWLWKTAETDASPYCRQECLAVLYTDLGQEKALEWFVRDTDQNGVATPAQKEWVFQTDWRLLKAAGQKFPQSFLGRGVKVYEEVRGQPYFEIDRTEESFNTVWVPPYGDEEYDPDDREIPGWEEFLAEFSRHPAADDAAYRLARCYEIKERFADAIKTMQQARFLPDGDMRYAADGRLVYILDVRMTYNQLKALSLEKLEPPLQAFVNYSLAVKEIRREDYAQAASRLEEFLKQEDLAVSQNSLPFNYFNDLDEYDFRGSVEKQLVEVKRIAGLQAQWEKSKDPADLYGLAAAIFHNEMLYYNHLWAGQRQYYNWLGHINSTGHGHAPAEMAVFVREMINYNHSLPYFQQAYQDQSFPLELKAKALYSTGLSYIGLDEWGQDASFGFNMPEITEKIVTTYRQFVQEYPDSSMADDALLALGAYTGDAAYLQRILEEYPQSDSIEKAKNLIQEMGSPYYRPVDLYGRPVPFKIMSQDDESVPQEIKEWIAANTMQPFTGSKTLGGWSYLLAAAGEKPTAGYSVGVISISGSSGKLKVYYRIDGPAPGQVTAQVITCPYVLIRIPANKATVEFVEGSPW